MENLPAKGTLLKHTVFWLTMALSIIAVVSCEGGSEPQWSDLLQQIRSRYPEVRQLSTEKLAADLQEPQGKVPILIDSRSEEEYAVSHLQGAKRAESVAEVESSTPDRDAFIVVYCSVGYRSSRLADQLMEAGFTNVYNLEGSIFKWANEGRPVFRDGREVSAVHPYDDDWGRLLNRSLWRYSIQ